MSDAYFGFGKESSPGTPVIIDWDAELAATVVVQGKLCSCYICGEASVVKCTVCRFAICGECHRGDPNPDSDEHYCVHCAARHYKPPEPGDWERCVADQMRQVWRQFGAVGGYTP